MNADPSPSAAWPHAADDLMSFAREHTTALPLTGVGKIFKPELKNREIEDALSESLRDAGVRTCSLKARSDPRYGTTVEVSVAEPLLQTLGAVSEALSRRFAQRRPNSDITLTTRASPPRTPLPERFCGFGGHAIAHYLSLDGTEFDDSRSF